MRTVIERLGLSGDGIAPGPVHVARALPGEEVEGEPVAGYMHAPRIVIPSPDRITPPCAHYRVCGGCQFQHASDRFVAAWKANALHNALNAQGLSTKLRPVITSPPRSRRRATLAGKRTRKAVIIGFHRRASDVLADVTDCLLLRPMLMAARPFLEEATALVGSRRGEVSFALNETPGGLDIDLRGGRPLDAGLRMQLAGLAAAHGLARLAHEGEPLAVRAPAEVVFGRARVVPPPGAFLQATREGEVALLAAVREAVGEARRVVDLFAGCGTFTLPLAERAEVHAVEAEAAMLAALDLGWRGTEGLKRVTSEPRDLFRRPLMGDELARFEAAVIDPPRAGAKAQVAEIAGSKLTRLAYVSCNPASFARDARVLAAAGFRLDFVQVVDQFRWSSHIELAAGFGR